MKTKLFSLCAIGALLLSSCEKDEDTSINTSTNNNSTSTTGDYQPLSVGNVWHYKGGVEYTNSIDKDTVINGDTYFVIENDQGSKSYMRKSGTDYYIIDETIYNDFKPHVILKEAGNEGDEWGFDISITNFGYTTINEYTFTIHDVLTSKTVNGKTYNDVLVIDLDIDTYLEGVYYASINDSRYYYAKGVGLILSEIPGAADTELKSYTVN